MKNLRIAIFALLCVGCSRVGLAQSISGITNLDIDPDSETVTATCETDTDPIAEGYYVAIVVCTVTDSNNNVVAQGGDTESTGTAQVVLTFAGTPGETYTAIGKHQALEVFILENEDPSGLIVRGFDDAYNFSSFSEDPQTYDGFFEWDGPGPEIQTRHNLVTTGDTEAMGTPPQIPTASRIVSTISSQTQSGCPADQAGWNRSVYKIMTDQNGSDITTTNQSLTEGVTISARNDLNLPTQVQTGTAITNGVGQFIDRLAFCSPVCPASSGETDATQVIGLPYQGQQHTLTPNAFVYKCTGNTINEK